MKIVSVHLKHQSEPIEYRNVINTYQKGDLFCIMLEGRAVDKFPIADIFRVRETYEPNLPSIVREAK